MFPPSFAPQSPRYGLVTALEAAERYGVPYTALGGVPYHEACRTRFYLRTTIEAMARPLGGGRGAGAQESGSEEEEEKEEENPQRENRAEEPMGPEAEDGEGEAQQQQRQQQEDESSGEVFVLAAAVAVSCARVCDRKSLSERE